MKTEKKELLLTKTEPSKVHEIIKRETEFLTQNFAETLSKLSDNTIKNRLEAIYRGLAASGQVQVKSEPDAPSPISFAVYRNIAKDNVEPVHSPEDIAREALAYIRDHAQKKIELMVFELAAEAVWFAPYGIEKKRGASDEQLAEILDSSRNFEQTILPDSIKRFKSLWPAPIQSQSGAYQLRIASKMIEGMLLHTYDDDEVIKLFKESYEYSAKGTEIPDATNTQYAKHAAGLVFKNLESAVWHMLCILVTASQTLAGQSIYHTFATEEDGKSAPPKPGKKALRGISRRVLDYWLSIFDDHFKGKGRPSKNKGVEQEALKKKKQELRKKVMDALRQLGPSASAASVAERAKIGSGKPESRARSLRRELASVRLSFEELQWQAKLAHERRTGK